MRVRVKITKETGNEKGILFQPYVMTMLLREVACLCMRLVVHKIIISEILGTINKAKSLPVLDLNQCH